MSSREKLSAPEANQKISPRLIELIDDQQRLEFFGTNPDYRERAVVEELADQVGELARVDLLSAEQVAATAMWLADDLDDDYCRGRSWRAAGNVSHYKGGHLEAFDLYEKALSYFQNLQDEKEVAITRSSALQNLVFLGKYQEAFEWADSARRVFERKGDRLRLARLELNIGNILFRQDRWEEASECYKSAYEEFLHVGRSRDVATALRNMAVCHSSMNNFKQALAFYERARAYCVDYSLMVFVVEIDYNIAYLYYLRGEYNRAIELYKNARAMCESVGEQYHMALCDLDQAEIFLELNLIEEAAQLAKDAYARFDELQVRYESAKALVFLAIAVSRQGKGFLAIDLLGKARETFVKEENRVWPALIDLYKALIIYRAGRPLEAARLAARALDVFLAASLRTKAVVCQILLAGLLLESGQREKARDQCDAALLSLRAMDVPALKYQVYFVLGQIEEEVGDRDSAVAAYEKSRENLEQLRSHLQAEELKIGFLDDKLQVYESLVSLMTRQVGSQEEKEAVFGCFEKAKSRSLADLIAFRAHALTPSGAARSDQAAQVRKLREELNWYYRQIDLQEMRGDDRSASELEQLRELSRRQEDHLLRTLRELQAIDQEYSSLQEAGTVNLPTMRAALAKDTLLLEYYIARGVVYACLLSREQFEIVPVTVASRVRDLHNSLQFQFSKYRLGDDYIKDYEGPIYEASMRWLGELYDELVAPIESLLRGKHLVVVPHGFLHYIPFHALYDGARFVIDRMSMSYAPSASVYYLSCHKEVAPEDKSLVVISSDAQGPLAEEEARLVAGAFPNPRFFVGPEVTEELFRIHGEKSRLIYVSTHGVYRQDNPMFSAIRLGDTELNLFDLFNLQLNAEMVILSGCGVRLRECENGDELVGLTRGILYAGAESVLVDLWEVHDQSHLAFMRSFSGALEQSEDRAEALRLAMLEVRKDFPHPFHWAPFVLVGKSRKGEEA